MFNNLSNVYKAIKVCGVRCVNVLLIPYTADRYVCQYYATQLSYSVYARQCKRKHIQTQKFQKIRRKFNFLQVGTEYTYDQIYMYVEGNTDDIQITAHWNLIGRSTTAHPAVLSPSSILPPPSSHCALIHARKFRCAFHKYYFTFSLLFKNCLKLKLHK
jgi:hypothetical protein